MLRDVDQALRDERATDRRWLRVAVTIERIRLQRRQDEVPHELLAGVDDVGTNGSRRERALADVGQLSALSQIERHRHDFSLASLGELPDRGDHLRLARVRQDDARGFTLNVHRVCNHSVKRCPESDRRLRSPTNDEDRVVTPNGADDISQLTPIQLDRERLRLPGVGLQHQHLRHDVVTAQVVGHRLGDLTFRSPAIRRSGLARAPVGPIRRTFNQLELSNIPRQRRLRRRHPPLAEPRPQCFLARNCFAVNHFQYQRLSVCLHEFRETVKDYTQYSQLDATYARNVVDHGAECCITTRSDE